MEDPLLRLTEDPLLRLGELLKLLLLLVELLGRL